MTDRERQPDRSWTLIDQCHGKRGRFDSWSRERRDAWEADQVRVHRRRYAMQFPTRAPAGDATESDLF